MAIKYFTYSDPSGLAENPEQLDATNPLFKFEKDFFDNFYSIPQTELASSIPYISIHSLGLDGEIIEDLNVNHFFKTINFSEINQGIRNADRPTISLKDLEVKTNQPSGSGYLYFTEVIITLKLHNPAALSNSQVISLTLPGMNHLLEYGWSSPNSFLRDFKEKLLFQVATYDLNYDETGQVDLKVRGFALNNFFNNTLVGDDGKLVASTLASNTSADGIARNKLRQGMYDEYLRDMKTRGNQEQVDGALKKALAEDYTAIENIARGKVSENIKTRRKALIELSENGNFKFHDVIRIMLSPTLDAMTQFWPTVDEFRVVYGDVNEKALGGTVKRSLANFPINQKAFEDKFGQIIRDGQFSYNVKSFLDMLMTEFLEDEQIWRAGRKEDDDFNQPDINIHFGNRFVPESNKQVMELIIYDVNFGLPVTTSNTPDGKVSTSEMQNKEIGNSGLLVLRLGHANSFVKKASLSQIKDQAMKTALIVKGIEDRFVSPRDSKLNFHKSAIAINPLRMPLQGTINVIGHTKWKPFRAFYLSTGSWLTSGCYKIMSVSHKLSADGFTTELGILSN